MKARQVITCYGFNSTATLQLLAQHDSVRQIRKVYTTNRRKQKLTAISMNLNCGNGEKTIQGVKDTSSFLQPG